MRWEICAAIITLVVSYVADGFINKWMDWPDAGAIVAICIMGAFILYEIRRPGDK